MRLLLLLVALIATRFAVGVPLGALGVPDLITAVVVVAALVAVYVWVGRRPPELSRPFARELGTGLAIGSGMFVLAVLIISVFGMYHLDGWGSFGGMLDALGLALMAGVFEEMVIRGVVFQWLRGRLGLWWALGISALVFGLLHLVNPGASLVGALGIAVEAGVMLGLAFVATGRLWLAIGIHTAWNFTQGGVFGLPVSGIASDGLLRSHLTGPAWLSGGGCGVEGSIITVLLGVAASVVLYRHAVKRERLWVS